MIPPAFLVLGFMGSERRHHLWLPLFLIWPLLWLLWLVALVFSAALDFVLWLAGRPYHHYSLLLVRCYGLVCQTKRMAVSVKGPNADFEFTLV